MGMSLYCFNRWCRKHVRDSHGLFPTITQKNKPRTYRNPFGAALRCLWADFFCAASAAGSCCGCKKTPYLGQIARNLSFAAAWIASRGHGKKALFRQNMVFFGGPAFRNKGKRIAGCDPRPAANGQAWCGLMVFRANRTQICLQP